jgi:fructose-bisphosphate aldolase class II/tagatose 1,6-diphosphate aldolase GatY/KbaY
MKIQEILKQLSSQGVGILATNFYNFETLSGVLQAAAALNRPLILQLTKSSIDYMGLQIAVDLARAGLRQYGVEGWLHLDHGDSLLLIERCLEAGFDSVMIDASEKPFDENVRLTSQVVRMAEKFDANVEAELGFVAKLGQSSVENGFTSPSEAREFVNATGVDALAIAIGSAHGFYQAEPNLQMDLLSEIRSNTDAILVLHGSSGIPTSQIKEAIRRGICKVNLATEIKNIFMTQLKVELSKGDEIDLRKVFPPATGSVKKLVMQKIQMVSDIR